MFMPLFIVFTLFPFYFSILNSFRDIRTIPDFGWLPTGLTLKWWREAFKSGSMVPRWFLNSVIVTLGISLLSLTFDSLAGYAFARKKFPARNFLFYTVMFCMTVPFGMLMIPIFFMMAKAHLLNTYVALILPAASAMGTFMMTQAISTIPVDLDEAAVIDG